ncbi:uncharacterized protein [Onthophagus taurus]|uniref:uncharacterized protein n=1 Tax=Onthophagus taurus TaxID=166361 RepID=UPI000C200DF1|nr:uncharacterized protein LOC111413079 [Onthophagus taurus]
MSQNQRNYYSNPAFCQQSEYFQQQRCKSPQRTIRQSPVGAQTKMRVLDTSVNTIQDDFIDGYEEQEFYEEMLVDGNGLVTEKKVVVVSSPQEKYHQKHRYEYIDDGLDEKKKRYEYIPMRRQEKLKREDIGRYALVPVDEIQNKNRYTVITEEDIKKSDRYEYIEERPPPYQQQSSVNLRVLSPHTQRRGNPVATQKLHELLSTPRKTINSQQILNINPQTPHKAITSQNLNRKNISPNRENVFITPPKPEKINRNAPRAQQKLNYSIGNKLNQQPLDKRHNTAIVAPMCSSPIQSVYSETTFSQKSESWMNLSHKAPVRNTLAVAAFMMLLCGGVNFGLCLYMISIMGRLYYLDFGIVAGFACFILGLMGFRTRNCYWLPNRNYISGYIVLSLFSLLTCSGLLILLFMQPKQGTPLADMTSGAVCCVSVLTLLLATVGLISSYCCRVPPPDNRVQHCVQGFTV